MLKKKVIYVSKEKVKGKGINKKKFSFDDIELTFLSFPTIVWYAIFSYLPMFGVVLAFKNYRLKPGGNFFESLLESDWAGLKNFDYLFARKDAMQILERTIGYNLIFILLGLVIPVTLAIMMSNLYSKRFAKIAQTAMFLPHFMSWVVISYFIFAFLSPEDGLAIQIMEDLGIQPLSYYTREGNKVWPYLIVFLNTWKSTGYGMVVYLAAISGIDTSLYEAALIDGATKWQQTTAITIPSLKPMMIILSIMAIGHIFNSDFGLFYQTTKGVAALYPSTLTLDVFVYNALTTTSIGRSAAASLFQSVAGCITIIIANSIVSKIDSDSAFF